jgi:TonB family protein
MKVLKRNIAAALAGLLCIPFAQAEQPLAPEAPASIVVSLTGLVSIAGLSTASASALPSYPIKAYRDGYRNGRVLLSYTVNADGTVSGVQVLKAYPIAFTRTATNAVAGWQFVPTGFPTQRIVEFRFTAE